MAFDPSQRLQDFLVFGEFGGVNPSITDSSTFTFMKTKIMEEVFDHEVEGCFLYSRQESPINHYLAQALAIMEDSESAHVTASGMGAISSTILQVCGRGDELISGRTIYGGTYALFKNVLPRFGIGVKFVDITNMDTVDKAVNSNTKLIFCESMSNPLLEVTNIPLLAEFANGNNLKLIVDNTFSPLIISPIRLGAHIVIHSLTKFVNGASDCIAGCICSDETFIHEIMDINSGMCMLMGPVLDSYRSANILKNMHTLHVRIKKHSANAMFLAEKLEDLGISVHYPGLPSHNQHQLMTNIMNKQFGYGGMLAFDAGDEATADSLMELMQDEKVGYLAVSLGFYKTLFSLPSSSTSSEISTEDQKKMGLSSGIIRMSVGLDDNIDESLTRIRHCLKKMKLSD